MGPFRVQPLLPVGAMQTYSVVAPLETHWRDATCQEVNCSAYLHGWVTAIDEATELGQRQAHYIRHLAARRFTETDADGFTEFTFEAGQRCFAAHKTPLERDPLLLVRLGDWRGYGPPRRHVRADDWIDDMQTSLDKVRDRQQRG